MKDKNNQDDGKGEEFPAFDYEVPDSATLKEEVSERNQDDKVHVENLQRETDEALLRLDGRIGNCRINKLRRKTPLKQGHP